MATVLNVEQTIEPTKLASDIANKWHKWQAARAEWMKEKKELRNYVYATSTKTTSNKTLPWANSTTTPKLCQIYDNLKANYSATLFPNTEWHRWEANSNDVNLDKKRRAIQGYMNNKIRQSQMEQVVDELLDDFILDGNCFATVEFARDYSEGPDGELVPGYIGPRLVRISPKDITFDPTSPSFEKTPKIIRALVGLGELQMLVEEGNGEYKEILDRMKRNRTAVYGANKLDKSEGFVADGFGDLSQYYESGFVELLTFYGNIYDQDTGELKTNRRITVVDRAYIISDEPIVSWLGKTPIFHAGWRNRPDNLYAMGPLDNLVGMQYRIDHLENLKADVFDQIALPAWKITGYVEDFDFAPNAKIIVGEEGNVEALRPDATALQANLDISVLENKMEEMAGAPRQAMGIRTPGEKTAFEVQTLQNSSSRIFQHKATKFEREFLEPILNAMLESARRNMDVQEEIVVHDDETGANLFMTITQEDILAKGKIVPLGARHYAERAQRVQNIAQLQQLKADPTIGAHLSGKAIAKLLAEELGEDALFGENIAVKEQQETQSAIQNREADAAEQLDAAGRMGL